MDNNTLASNANQKKMNILINNKHFVTSLVEILDLLSNKSNELDLSTLDLDSPQNVRLYKDHTRLRKACNVLKYNFTSDDADENFAEGQIIKKVYKTLTTNLSLFFPDSKLELFSLTDKNGAIVTIIPSIDIRLIAKTMNESELNTLWGYLYMLYVSAVGMILEANDHKKEGKVWAIIPQMKEKITQMGIMKDGKIFNPFIGIAQDNEKYDVNTMFQNVEKSNPTGPSMDDVLKLAGVDKLVDIDHLNDQLKNVKQEDISEATKNITKLLGAENDEDINDVCSTLVEGIVSDLRANPDRGIKNMFETAKSVTEKIGNKLDKSKMEKTAMQLSRFLQNGESNLKNMTDDKGNPIGDKIMKSLEGPLKFAQNFKSNGEPPNLAQYQNLIAQVSKSMNDIKNG